MKIDEIKKFAKANLDDLNYFHTKAVVELALKIAEKEGADKEIVKAAAWLHDIGKIKKQAKTGPHHLLSVEIAKKLLKEQGCDKKFIERVCACVKEHVGPYSQILLDKVKEAGLTEADIPRPSTTESKCVYDADMINYMGPWGTSKVIFLEAKKGTLFRDVIKQRKIMPKIIFDDLKTETGKELGKKELEFIQEFMKKINVEEQKCK
jgi:uncharacterized protein